MAVPLWKDMIVDLGAFDSILFRIRVNGTSGDIIYSGKAFRKPGETHIHVRINDICADWLLNVFPNMSQAEFTEINTPVHFYVQRYVNDEWVSVLNVAFNNDWSYDDSYNPETMGMAFPVNGHIDARQWLTYTAYDAESITAIITLADGTSFSVIIPIAIQTDFNLDYNDDFARSLRTSGSGTAVFDLSAWDNVASVAIGGKRYDVVTDCKEWALYYTNAYGGWDSLLIEGNAIETDNLTRHTREMFYDNSSSVNRGRENYVNEISKTYTLHTSWMSDDESARMHHLLNSTNVYLGNINTGVMIPVILNNSTTEYKTYKGNGGRLVNYTIEATIAQGRIRR